MGWFYFANTVAGLGNVFYLATIKVLPICCLCVNWDCFAPEENVLYISLLQYFNGYVRYIQINAFFLG